MFHDDTLGFYRIESNACCRDAIAVMGRQGLCIHDCPFGDCLHELKPSEKQLIMQAPIIRQVYKCKDQGIAPQVFPSVPKSRIMAWLRRRKDIEPKIQRYGIVANATT